MKLKEKKLEKLGVPCDKGNTLMYFFNIKKILISVYKYLLKYYLKEKYIISIIFIVKFNKNNTFNIYI